MIQAMIARKYVDTLLYDFISNESRNDPKAIRKH